MENHDAGVHRDAGRATDYRVGVAAVFGKRQASFHGH